MERSKCIIIVLQFASIHRLAATCSELGTMFKWIYCLPFSFFLSLFFVLPVLFLPYFLPSFFLRPSLPLFYAPIHTSFIHPDSFLYLFFFLSCLLFIHFFLPFLFPVVFVPFFLEVISLITCTFHDVALNHRKNFSFFTLICSLSIKFCFAFLYRIFLAKDVTVL